MSDNNSITILLDKCVGCTLCVKACPFGAIHMANKKAVIDMAKCNLCGACVPVCKFNAIEIRKEAGEKKDSSMDRLDSILADCDKMEKRVDALCASRKDVESVEPGQKVKITYGDSVYDLVSAREAGKKAEKAGKPITANPFPKRMSDTDPDQIRKHDSWESGWEYSRDAASGWEPHAGQM